MLSKLEVQALKADLASVQSLLDMRTKAEDPVGYLQFQRRKAMLEESIASIQMSCSSTSSVALLFGGAPAVGSRGVNADFGAKAIGNFQDIVALRYAIEDGPLAPTGPIPGRARAQLMVTDVVRGSFGFVLEEQVSELFETQLRPCLDAVLDLIQRTAASDEEDFNGCIDDIDPRLVGALRSFFRHLDDSGATLRLVGEAREFKLSCADIRRGKERSEALEIMESELGASGKLYIFPEARRFELVRENKEPALHGRIAPDFVPSIVDTEGNVIGGILGASLDVRVLDRALSARGGAPRHTYTLIGITRGRASD